ncbi:hypothetical protein HNY73_022989 [Argiope bruennichi]|uniref:Uncharacterized protein n=1 Tax=Argiope bruennichi TaxID=94029 RepID=A0A8T0E3T2_ARGBR|nr:hypothetical protein HNY73_022989 [Argiope bruennichi]
MESQEIPINSNSELLNATINRLERGEREIILKHEYRDLVLILGDTVIDNSFIQWITGKYTNTTLTEDDKNSDQFINNEDRKIRDFTLQYQKECSTILEEPKTNVIYYGCSCLSDHSSTSEEIATAYFTNKVLNHSERIKIIFAVNYRSIIKGTDMNHFMKFLKHASNFVKNIDRYRNSIAMMAISVGEQHLKKDDILLLTEDNQLIREITDFLLEVRQQITDKQKDAVISVQEQAFYEYALKFIDIVLTKNNDGYKKIGIFRELKSNIDELQERTNNMKNILCEELEFVEKLDIDFRCNISEKSNQDIDSLEQEINNAVWFSVKSISDIVSEHYKNQIQQLLRKLENISTGKIIVDADPVKAVNLSFKLKNDYYTISNLVNALQNSVKVKSLNKKIKDVVSELYIGIPEVEIHNIEKYVKYIDILQAVSQREFVTRPWGNLFKEIATYISESRKTIQQDIDNAAEKVKLRIQLHLNNIAKIIQDNYNEKLKSKFTMRNMEIQKFHDFHNKEYEDIFKLTEDIKRLRNIDSLVKKLQLNTNILGIRATKRYLIKMANEGRYFMFLSFLSDKILDNGSSTWSKPFVETKDIIQKSDKWYKFLSDLFIKFSDYNTQMRRKSYIDFLEGSTKSDIFKETNITPINLQIFLSKIKNLNVAEYESIKNITLTESQLNELNQLVDLTLKHKINIECSETHMFVKGDYVSLQEVHRILFAHDDKKCREFYHWRSHRKFVNIFALNTLFIDRDLDVQGDAIQIIFISPRWEVIGNRVINLNGLKGMPHSINKAYDGRYPGNNGSDGKPGKPGGPGEIFFGIGETFVNGANLTITANGGAGGPGQHGGRGRDGISGDDVELPEEATSYERNSLQCCHSRTNAFSDFSKEEEGLSATLERRDGRGSFSDIISAFVAVARRDYIQKITHLTQNGFGCERTSLHSSNLPRIGRMDWFDGPRYYEFLHEDYKLLGKPGKKGGDGGNGGKGGIGGKSGSITIAEMESPSVINKIAKDGETGEEGKGGWGGKGGKDGDDVTARCLMRNRGCGLFWCINYIENFQWALDERITHDLPHRRGLDGREGLQGANNNHIESPMSAKFIHEPAKFINVYKSYLRENLADDLKKISLVKFYDQLNKNNEVNKFYETEGLAGEFIDMENQFNFIKKGVDFYPFYKSLLKRIGEFSDKYKASGDQKIVLSYLYAAVLSKINSLKESNESDLIIDIEKYLDTIKTDMDILKNLENSNNKVNAVDKMKREYKSRIDEKIQEAKSFIENTVDQEINKISEEIDNKIDLLIIETISLQKEAQKAKDDLIKKKKELQNTLGLRKLFDYFKSLGRIVSFLGPYGMAAGALIELSTSVGESLALGNNLQPIELSRAASKLISIENNIKNMRIEKTDHINNVLTELSERTMQYPEELGDISSKVAEMKKRLNDIRSHKLQYKEVRNLERELKDTLKTKEINLNSQTQKRRRDVSKIVRKLGQAIDVASMFVNFYNKNKESDDKIAAINDAIEQKENELRNLKEYEEQIYENISPALQNMKNNLQEFASGLEKRSQVALDVGKWQMQSVLKDIKVQMQRVTEGMEVKDDLARCIEKLEEAMSILITIYDRIQQYQDEQILSNHIANICSISTSTLSITDRNLVNVTNHLEWSIRSSLVLKHYQTALNAFKQWVFPFASHYLEESMMPSHLQVDGNMRGLVFNAAKQIGNLKKKISLYKASARETDEILIRGEFNNPCGSCDPFFVWKDEKYRSEISKLLSGQAVALKSDVRLSEPGKDAIKFRLIKLYFRSKNESVQTQLDETLKMFDISATHIGNSYYRYDEEIYLITSPKKTILYSFEENSRTGDPVRENEVYAKIKSGDLMLSPYTMWIFKLNATRKSTFRELSIYKGEIDLELEGKGSYVINDAGFQDDDYDIENQLESSDLNYRITRSLIDDRKKKCTRLADLFQVCHPRLTRSFTGIKYESEMDESLLSPKQVIFRRCKESSVKSDNDIRKNLRLLSEMDDSNDKSLFRSVKLRLKSVLEYLGFLKKADNDEYIRDIRNLFVED